MAEELVKHGELKPPDSRCSNCGRTSSVLIHGEPFCAACARRFIRENENKFAFDIITAESIAVGAISASELASDAAAALRMRKPSLRWSDPK